MVDWARFVGAGELVVESLSCQSLIPEIELYLEAEHRIELIVISL